MSGYLYGVVCARLEVLDPAGGAEIFALPSAGKEVTAQSMGGAADAQEAKAQGRTISERELRGILDGRRSYLKGTTQANGSFCLRGEDDGGLLDFYAAVSSVPLGPDGGERPLPERFIMYLGTYDPPRTDAGRLVKLIVAQAIWCRLKRAADAWTIVGKVAVCDRPEVSVGGVTVSATDADIVEDDPLGSAVTSGAGIFRIDYLGEAYRKGTLVDVELFGGPDVYFKVEDADGNVLLKEDSSSGREPGRCDSGPCLCVDLCVKVDVPPPGGGAVPSIWTGIGSAFVIPDASSLNSFDADGYAGAAEYALTGAPSMTGSAALRTTAGNPIEYRFRVSTTTAPNGTPNLPAADFGRIVGVSPNEGLFVACDVGKMVRYAPLKIVPITAKAVDLDAEGWLDVNKSIQRTFVELPDVDPVDIPAFVYIDDDPLMAINTAGLTTGQDVPNGAAATGASVPAADRIAIEKFAIRFEVREVKDKANGVFGAMPGDGVTVNSLVMNNNSTFVKLAMTEHLLGTPCDILTGTIHVAYTVYHPHLASVDISIKSNDGSYHVDLSDPPVPLAGNTNPAVVDVNNPGAPVPNGPPPIMLHKCTYLVKLSAVRRLHNGESGVAADPAETTFFWEP